MIAEYDAPGKNVSLKEVGEGWLSEFKEHLAACEGVAWGGFRCNGVDNRGSVVCKRPKAREISDDLAQQGCFEMLRDGKLHART